ncbi:uncharacterized protein LOC129227712 [Uloborus diversus]|uniref:uncharacterized protein LOC129227712 n=1 Tax=Uloborus diversus TaxID=327109 RepID=UPI0024092FDF|nr:uncharacterized protein LOC129227712 [Uloborus diversus]
MQLLDRIILVSEDTCIPRDLESRAILTIFPAIQNAACTLLETMLLNFPTEMETIAQYITKLFDGLLLASRTNPVTRHQLSQIRSSTWKVLNLWIVQYGVNGVLYILQGNILDELRMDIDIRELPAEATESVKNQKVCLDTYSVKSPVGAWTVSSCCEALGVFRDMFYVGMPFLEQAIVENITADVILILCKIQNSKDFPFPYGNVDCRRQIYEVLLAIVISQGPHQSFALRHSVGMFNRGLKDPSFQIVRICQQGIAHCKNILHPKKHTLPGIQQASEQRADEEWQRNAWGSQIPWALEENQLEQDVPNVSQTVEIGPSYHGNSEADLHVAESYSSTGYNEHISEGQVNGESEVVVPKFQNWRQDEEEEMIVEKKIFKDVSEKVSSEAKPAYSYSEPMPVVQEVEVAQNSFNEQSVEEKMECDTLQIVEKNQPGKELNEEVCQNGDVVVSDEEMSQIPIAKTENGECSVSSSEENSEEEEEEVEEEEYEEAESVEDSPVKKLQISSEDLESDDGNPPPQSDSVHEEVEADEVEHEAEPQADLPELVETEDKPPSSPSLKQMCDTFVLCENKDAS